MSNPEPYFVLAERARQGELDAAVAELRTWNWRSFRTLRDFLDARRAQLEGPTRRILDKWDSADIEALALLHTAAAIRGGPLSTEEASHANWAQQLLGLFEGLDVDQTRRRRWHLAWGAHLQSTLRLRELADHLHQALRRWPDDPDLLTMAGSVYESWAHRVLAPASGGEYVPMQGRMQRLYPEERRSRALAAEYYRRALQAQPDRFDARLRLGRLALESGRLDDAVAHVSGAGQRASSPREAYLAHLFLGRIHEAAHRWPEAAAAYRDAGGLLEGCQVWALAMSHATLNRGTLQEARAEARAAVERANAGTCREPWWEYEFGFGPRADELFAALWQGLRR